MKWIGTQTVYDNVRFKGDVDITGTLNLTGDTVTFTSANADDPAVIIQNTTNDAEAARLQFFKNRGADGQDADKIGEIEFWSYDDGTPSLQQYGKITCKIHDATSGQESGQLLVSLASHVGDMRQVLLATGGSELNEVDVTIANGVNSVTTIEGDLSITTGLILDSVDITTIQTSSESFADRDTELMTSAAIEDKILSYGYSTTTGDITGVTLATDDEGSVSDSSGAVSFTVAGSNGLSTSSSGSTLTITGTSASASDKGVVELATTAETTTGTDTGRAVTPDGLKDGYQGSSNVTTLGTIGTGVWNGTAVATGYTAHLMHYRFMGYGQGDGTNYFLGQPFTDAQSPWEHADSSSADGTTIPAGSGTNVSELMRSGGHVMPKAATLKRWQGWGTYNGSDNAFVSIYKWTPVDDDSTAITPVLLDTATIDGEGNDKARSFAETTFTQASVAAGDIIFTQVKTETNNKTVYFNSTLEVEF